MVKIILNKSDTELIDDSSLTRQVCWVRWFLRECHLYKLKNKQSLEIIKPKELAQFTGKDSINQFAEPWNVYGTDLGHIFTHKGDIYMVFSDTFGFNDNGWRSNVMARVAGPHPPKFKDMIAGSDGNAKELISDEAVEGEEVTVIPIYGISDESRMYLHYMAV